MRYARKPNVASTESIALLSSPLLVLCLKTLSRLGLCLLMKYLVISTPVSLTPNNNEFIEKLCLLEGTEDGVATASGMAAMFVSIAAFVQSGDHIVASRSLFGSTHQILTQLLPRWGITHSYVDITAPFEEWERSIQENTKMIFVETPSNPGLDLIDLEELGELAKRHNLIFNVDNCFATPYVQSPAEWGAHIITHSDHQIYRRPRSSDWRGRTRPERLD